jgi:Cu(I)-responsive transcriptional regulator
VVSGFGPEWVGVSVTMPGKFAALRFADERTERAQLVGSANTLVRTESGYRQYTGADVHTLRFIKRCRDLGFSMAEIAELVNLWQNRSRASASVKRIAQKHVDELSARISAMQAMQRSLNDLLQHCHGDARPDCPILDDLAGGGPAQPCH